MHHRIYDASEDRSTGKIVIAETFIYLLGHKKGEKSAKEAKIDFCLS